MTDLSVYKKPDFKEKESPIRSILWYIVSHLIFTNYLFPFYGIKKSILTAFGAKIGNGFVIKPCVNIKFPWKLEVGNHVWIGEKVWIDNLGQVKIGNHVCISQGATLLTGNHNYRSVSFDLIIKPIVIEDGVWIGAKAVVAPGVICKTNAVLTLGSILTGDMEADAIYQGNPAFIKKDRQFNS
jgi:putative colanic acid biosynthesis acetyltransferase WcaF